MEANQQGSTLIIRPNEIVGKCVCHNLCNCGGHRCCSVGVANGTINTSRKDNRCAWEQEQEGQEERDNDRHFTEGGPREDGCRCMSSPGERYLATTGTMLNASSETGDDIDEALMHVLVTRPEIAGKPKDNIVFEGDMDLKTTFETSYEALAKMRLKCLKRHQEILEAKKGRCCRIGAGTIDGLAECHRGSSKAEPISDEATSQRNEQQQQQQQQAVSVAVDHKQLAWARGVGDGGDSEGDVSESRSVEPPVLSSEEAGHACSQPGGSGKRVDVAVQADLTAMPLPLSQPTTTTITPHPSLQKSCHAKNQIDPDLTPIIVYNANMNRLDRVGLRKRSKYRPSTSLRSGARGLFGDQELEQNGTSSSSGSCQTESMKREQLPCGNATTTLEDLQTTPKRETNYQIMAQNYNTTGRLWDAEPTTKTELALNARNLKDSSQRDYLMYTDGNLPIDCKRKLGDNVNMIDHIKEQNMCETRQVNSAEPKMSAIDELQQQNCQPNNESSHIDCRDQTTNEESEDLKLAEQEEDAAVKELQKITSQAEENQVEWCIHNIRGTDKSEADKDERKSRLKRTCQNQNFDIYDNDYQETHPEETTRMEERGTLFSPQAKLFTNLFRESPDFIMTTGKFMDQEVQNLKINKDSADV